MKVKLIKFLACLSSFLPGNVAISATATTQQELSKKVMKVGTTRKKSTDCSRIQIGTIYRALTILSLIYVIWQAVVIIITVFQDKHLELLEMPGPADSNGRNQARNSSIPNPGTPPVDDAPPTSVILFVIAFNEICIRATNILIRIGMFMLFPKIVDSFEKLFMFLKESRLKRDFNEWSSNEIVFLIILVASQLVRQATAVLLMTETMRETFRVSNTFSLFWKIISLQVSSIVSRGFPLEVICFILLSFITFTAKNILKPETLKKSLSDLPEQSYSKLMVRSKVSKAVGIRRIQGIIDHYINWYLLWNEFEPIIGFVSLIIFLDLTLTICLGFFISLTSGMDLGLTNMLFLRSITGVCLSAAKMTCLGNAAHLLHEAVRFTLHVLLSYNFSDKNYPGQWYNFP